MLLLEIGKMSWLKKVFSSQSSQETKFVHETSKNESEKDKKDNDRQIIESKIEEENKESSQGSDSSWFSSWSVLSTTFDWPKSKKRGFGAGDEEEDKWWSSFCSKERNESKSESFFSTQVSSSTQSSQATNIPTQTFVDKDGNEDDDEDDSKVEFFI